VREVIVGNPLPIGAQETYPVGRELPRISGVLLHPTSLPGGRLGPEAYELVDWLAAAGQGLWQVLPLTPPGRDGSPYRSRSAFAAWPGLLADPRAPVAPEEERAFREREAYWIAGWERAAGRGAVAAQVRFQREWGALRRYARERGIEILGDVPFYVGPGSVEERERPELFRRDVVSGVPPDAFSASGQLWGNAVYDWAAMRRDGYRFWVERLRRALDLHDWARIDHFRAFVAYWQVPAGARTARRGRWVRGPGAAPLLAAARALGPLPLVAEDLGLITPAVERLRDRLGLPGMRVLQFAWEGGPGNVHRPENHPEHAVVFTGTHDNDTTAGWWAGAPERQRRAARRAMAAAGIDEPDPVWGLVRLCLSSRARVSVVPLQDLLGLGSDARMNRPGTRTGNWSWRMAPDALTPRLAERLRDATRAAGRLRSG
jgi:4-alpha-glucanotransferase